MTCTQPDCTNAVIAKGLCPKHYRRARRAIQRASDGRYVARRKGVKGREAVFFRSSLARHMRELARVLRVPTPSLWEEAGRRLLAAHGIVLEAEP